MAEMLFRQWFVEEAKENWEDIELSEIIPPENGYYIFGVDAIAGHTYVSLAREGEEGCFIAFRVVTVLPNEVIVDYSLILKYP